MAALERRDVAALGTGEQDLVARTLMAHGASLLAVAQRHSLCHDDAADAVQRGAEIFLRRASTLDPDSAHRWIHTVVKHEAMAVRAERARVLPPVEFDFDADEERSAASPEEVLIDRERVARTAEALHALKAAEVQAIWRQAAGTSYEDIADELGWTRTKVNRSLAEGRSRLKAQVRLIETGSECRRWSRVLARLAAGKADAQDLADVRPHLRNCSACRAQVRVLHEQERRAERRGHHVFAPVGLLLGALHERAVGAVVRGQAMLDALTTGKAAAVAASAAALAGGGFAAADRVIDPPSRGQAALVRTAEEASRGEGPGPGRAGDEGGGSRAAAHQVAASAVGARPAAPAEPAATARAEEELPGVDVGAAPAAHGPGAIEAGAGDGTAEAPAGGSGSGPAPTGGSPILP